MSYEIHIELRDRFGDPTVEAVRPSGRGAEPYRYATEQDASLALKYYTYGGKIVEVDEEPNMGVEG